MFISHKRFLFSLICILTIFLSSGFWLETAHGQKKQMKQGGGGPKHVFTGPAPYHSFDVILARPTSNSITISVLAYEELQAWVQYGTEKDNLSAKTTPTKVVPDKPFEFVLKNLTSDTQYHYQLYTKKPKDAEPVPGKISHFHTQRKPGSAFTFTVQSDSHLDQGTRPAVYEKTLANALEDNPDFHVDIGDTFMTDKYPNFKDSLPQYLAQRYYLGQMSHSSPLFLVLGNHDGERLDRYDGKADSMPVWSCLNRKKYFPNPYPDGFYSGNKEELKPIGKLENYYAFEWGDAQFIALDPFWNTKRNRGKTDEGNWSRTLGETQFKWLEKTLASSKAKYKFVFIHHLVGGLDESARGGSEAAVLYEWGGKNKEGQDEFKARRPGWSMPIHSLFVKHKVSVVFHGHDHFFAKQDLDKVVYLMVPQPGHPGSERLKNVDEYGYVRGDFLSPAGHIRVSVSAEMAKIDYVRSVLPQSETAERKNKAVAYSFKISP